MKKWLIYLITSATLFSANAFSKSKPTLDQPTEIYFSSQAAKNGDLVVGVYADLKFNGVISAIDKNANGVITHALKVTKFDGKASSSKLIAAPEGSGYEQILFMGLGDRDEDKSDFDWQKIGGNAVQEAIKTFKTVPQMVFDDLSPEATAQLVFGAKLGSYYFDKYYTDPDKKKRQQRISFVVRMIKKVNSLYKTELDPVANAIWHTRDISNEPANIIYPESFVNRWKRHFQGIAKTKIKVFDEKDMLKNNMGAIYGVGRGSKRPPRMMIVEYMGGKKGDAPIVLVGKGITFDSGGISIKGSNNMWNMKFDMSGAASVVGTVHALAGRKAKVNLVAIAALAENMPGGNAQRPGDVVKSMSGKTIQIRSTDAEGRLVLADGIYYGDVTYNPQLLVDLATLTGSAGRALGKDYGALFTRHDDLVSKFIAAGKASGEEVWQLPLNKNHFKAIENNVADVMNSGPDAPGASAGAAFVGSFVRETTNWVHLDIAGVAWGDKTKPLKASPGSTSYGVRLLNQYIKDNFEK